MKKLVNAADGGTKLINITKRAACSRTCYECQGFKHTPCDGVVLTAEGSRVCEFQIFQKRVGKQDATVRAQAIRAYCLTCMGGPANRLLVKECTNTLCPVYAWRMSKTDKSTLINDTEVK